MFNLYVWVSMSVHVSSESTCSSVKCESVLVGVPEPPARKYPGPSFAECTINGPTLNGRVYFFSAQNTF